MMKRKVVLIGVKRLLRFGDGSPGVRAPALGSHLKNQEAERFRSLRHASTRKVWHPKYPVWLRAMGFEKLSSETPFEVNGDSEFLGLPLTSEQFVNGE
jgi:hypothetical protein